MPRGVYPDNKPMRPTYPSGQWGEQTVQILRDAAQRARRDQESQNNSSGVTKNKADMTAADIVLAVANAGLRELKRGQTGGAITTVRRLLASDRYKIFLGPSMLTTDTLKPQQELWRLDPNADLSGVPATPKGPFIAPEDIGIELFKLSSYVMPGGVAPPPGRVRVVTEPAVNAAKQRHVVDDDDEDSEMGDAKPRDTKRPRESRFVSASPDNGDNGEHGKRDVRNEENDEGKRRKVDGNGGDVARTDGTQHDASRATAAFAAREMASEAENTKRREEALLEREKQEAFEKDKREALEFEKDKREALEWKKQEAVEVEKRDALEVEKRAALEVEKRDALEVEKHEALEVDKRAALEVEKQAAVAREKRETAEREKRHADETLARHEAGEKRAQVAKEAAMKSTTEMLIEMKRQQETKGQERHVSGGDAGGTGSGTGATSSSGDSKKQATPADAAKAVWDDHFRFWAEKNIPVESDSGKRRLFQRSCPFWNPPVVDPGSFKNGFIYCASSETIDQVRQKNLLGTYFPITTFRLPDCPYETDTFGFIVPGLPPAGAHLFGKKIGPETAIFLCRVDNHAEKKIDVDVYEMVLGEPYPHLRKGDTVRTIDRSAFHGKLPAQMKIRKIKTFGVEGIDRHRVSISHIPHSTY